MVTQQIKVAWQQRTKKTQFPFFVVVAAVDHCFSNPCRNNRPCINMLYEYQCDCGVNFTGQNCEFGKSVLLQFCNMKTVIHLLMLL